MSHRKQRHCHNPRSKEKRRVEILKEGTPNFGNRKLPHGGVMRSGARGRDGQMSQERNDANTTTISDSIFDTSDNTVGGATNNNNDINNNASCGGFIYRAKNVDTDPSESESSHPIQQSYHDASYDIKPKSNRCPGCHGHVRGCSRRIIANSTFTSEEGTQLHSKLWSPQSDNTRESIDKSPSEIERVIGIPRRASSPIADAIEESITADLVGNEVPRMMANKGIPVDFVIELSTDIPRSQPCFVLRNGNETVATKSSKKSKRSKSINTTRSTRKSESTRSRRSARAHNCEQRTCPNYIGVMTKEQAERKVIKNSTFRIYHHYLDFPSEPSLKLFVVYKNSRGTYQHYPINRVETLDGKVMFQVDMEDEHKKSAQPIFPTIELLIKYYSTYVHMRRCRVTGELMVDAFGQPAAPKIKE